MSADSRRAVLAALPALLSACSWFTDFKDQPKIEPWESASDTVPYRSNPQFSVPITGTAVPVIGTEYCGCPGNPTCVPRYSASHGSIFGWSLKSVNQEQPARRGISAAAAPRR